MQPNAMAQVIDSLLRLPLLGPAQLKELIHHLPDPQAGAREMLGRGWITPDQFSSLFPSPQQWPTSRETLLVGFGDDELPPDAECENWDLTISDQEDTADAPSEVEAAQSDRAEEQIPPKPEIVDAVPALAGTPQFEWDMLAPAEAGTCRRESDTDRRLRQWTGWASRGLLVWALFVGSFFAGRRFLGADSQPPRETRKSFAAAEKTRVPKQKREGTNPRPAVARAAKIPDNMVVAKGPAPAAELRPMAPVVPVNNARQRNDVADDLVRNERPAAPVVPIIISPPAVQDPFPMPPRQDVYGRRDWVSRQPRQGRTQFVYGRGLQLVPARRLQLVPAAR